MKESRASGKRARWTDSPTEISLSIVHRQIFMLLMFVVLISGERFRSGPFLDIFEAWFRARWGGGQF